MGSTICLAGARVAPPVGCGPIGERKVIALVNSCLKDYRATGLRYVRWSAYLAGNDQQIMEQACAMASSIPDGMLWVHPAVCEETADAFIDYIQGLLDAPQDQCKGHWLPSVRFDAIDDHKRQQLQAIGCTTDKDDYKREWEQFVNIPLAHAHLAFDFMLAGDEKSSPFLYLRLAGMPATSTLLDGAVAHSV